VGNVSTNVCAKFRCTPLCIMKALGIFRELITTRRTTTVAFLVPAFQVQKLKAVGLVQENMLTLLNTRDAKKTWWSRWHNQP